MQKQEFEERIERTVTDEQYKVIEEFYMWHPSIRNTSGKDEVAELLQISTYARESLMSSSGTHREKCNGYRKR